MAKVAQDIMALALVKEYLYFLLEYFGVLLKFHLHNHYYWQWQKWQ
jgi:hypothetical protein